MNLPSIINIEIVAAIAALVLVITQYIKNLIPSKFVPPVAILVGIGLSFLYFYKPAGGTIDVVAMIANGVLGALMADAGYNFLSPKNSPLFSLPSKKETTEPGTPVTPGGAK